MDVGHSWKLKGYVTLQRDFCFCFCLYQSFWSSQGALLTSDLKDKWFSHDNNI